MKKLLLIILAVVLILVGGIWVYLMLFGAPESSDDFFTDLGFGTSETPPTFDVTPEPVNDFNPTSVQKTAIDSNSALNLVTVRPTAGAIIIGTTTINQKVRYVEKGSGIIHEINLRTNSDEILDPTGTENTHTATWSNDGRFVVLETGLGDLINNHLLEWVETASSSGFESTELPPDARQFGFSSDGNTLYYIRTDNAGSLAYRYDVNTKDASVWFSVPFIAANFEWSGDVPIVYNRPGEGFDGFAYFVKNGSLVSAGPGGEALVAKKVSDSSLMITSMQNGILQTSYHDQDIPFISTPSLTPVLPEKCATTYTGTTTLYCAFPSTQSGYLPTDWYKGIVVLQDNLWRVDYESGLTSQISNLSNESGQVIDVVNMVTDYTGTQLLFNDKSTGALWLYDTTK